MEHFPLITKNKKNYNHDMTPILREAFQDLLGDQIFPKNVSKNMEKYNLKMEALKDNAMTSNLVYSNCNHHRTEVESVEFELMARQAEYFVNKDIITNDIPENERIKLKRPRMIRELPQRYVQKYGLIETEDLMPYLPERAIDFRINSNRHLCPNKCELDLDIYPSKLSKPVHTPKLLKNKFKEDVIFEASPKLIVFNDYELKVTYEKKIKLRNITNRTRPIRLKVAPKSKYFTIIAETSCRIAGGMCAVYSIKYNTDIYCNVKEEIVFSTYTGSDVKVIVKSQRLSPCLRIFIFRSRNIVSKAIKLDSLSDEFFDIDRTMALNTSIDCGSTLIGDEVMLSIIMKNEGGFGKFFFVTENDWFCSTIQHNSERNELLAGAFQIHPAYFAISQNEFSEVALSFYPRKYGLFVETVYLLCNNNTYEELDFMGDGVYFEKNFISFELKKKDSRPFFLDSKSDYCLHLGKCLTCAKHNGVIRVINNSPLNLSYRWAVRHSTSPKCEDFKRMAPHWITIRRISSLPPHSSIDFDILFYPETTSPGLYRIVLSLYIENIPEISLRNFQEFTVLEKPVGEKKLLDILMGEVELLCQVEVMDVIIEPNPLIIPFDLPTHANYKQTVKILPNTTFPLNCEWAPHKSNKKIKIQPQNFTLNAEPFECEVYVKRTELEDIEEDFLLQINGGLHKFHFRVIVQTVTAQASLSLATIDFGSVMLDFIYKRELRVENNSRVTIQWHVNEDVADLNTGVISTIEGALSVTPNWGTLSAGEFCTVVYTASTQKCGEWLSYLKLHSNLAVSDTPDFACGIHYKVCRPEIVIHTNTSEFPILFPEEMLYIGVPVSYKICLHNCGNIVVIFMCGKPTGISSSDFSIVVTPSIGIINIKENVQVDVTITPKSLGYFEDIYLPVFTLGRREVTLIKLMCLVEDIAICIHLPDNEDNYIPILWPKMYPDVVEEICADEYSPIYKAEEETSGKNFEDGLEMIANSFDGREIKLSDRQLLPTPEERCENLRTSKEDVVETLYQYSRFGSSNNNTPHTSDNDMNLAGPHGNARSDGDTMSVDSMDARSLRSTFEKQFGPKLNLQEFMIEFRNVPLKTPTKKTIKIENITPGSGPLNVEVTNFYHTELEKNILNEMLIQMNMAKSTEWEDLVTGDGLVIKVDYETKTIKGFETIEFDIWVYANTWGYYLDEVVIDVSQMLPFSASVLVEVVGLPVEFPIAQNSICKDPTLRLGVLPYNSNDNCVRKLKVVNTSAVPISVSWHLFVNLDGAEKEFNVIFDMPDIESQKFSDEKIEAELFLTDKYYGDSNTQYFEIRPMISYIEPHGFAYVEIATNACNFGEDDFRNNIEANLLGVIRLPSEFRYLPNTFVRPTGINLGLARARITLEITSLELLVDAMPSKIEIVAYATDIMETQVFTHRKRFIIRNSSTCPAVVFLEIGKPFSIFCTKTPSACVAEFKHSIILNPRECMEVFVECLLTCDDVHKMVETLRNSTKELHTARPNFEDNSLKISRFLSIYQEGHLEKTIPLELKIFYPIFKAVPGSIKFDTVYIGNMAKSTLMLRNLTASAIRYEVYKCNKTKEITVLPSTDMIPKIGDGGTCTLNIFFSPTEPKSYEEWIAITTTIAHHYVIINITGTGMYDEKYYLPGLH